MRDSVIPISRNEYLRLLAVEAAGKHLSSLLQDLGGLNTPKSPQFAIHFENPEVKALIFGALVELADKCAVPSILDNEQGRRLFV